MTLRISAIVLGALLAISASAQHDSSPRTHDSSPHTHDSSPRPTGQRR